MNKSHHKFYIRAKRQNQNLFLWPCQFRIPVPLSTKNAFEKKSRKYRMSQAELGAVVIMHYLEQPALLAQAVRVYRNEKRAERKRYLKERYYA